MTQPIQFSLVLHNHQPIGNFDHVFEQAYQDSYLPFLEVFEPYADLKIALHTSGPLMEWLDRHHPEYLDRLSTLVRYGRVEIVGGAFYEPILAMIPSRDRIGQITTYTRWLEDRLGADVRGMWVPERVWEQSMTRDIAAAGIEYTVLDDFHFKNAGLPEEKLCGHYVTEDDGRLLRVFPGSERLRYLLPFQEPEETIAYLGRVSDAHPGAVLVFGDDGEKFGTWPETHKHVYENGWLRRFFDLLTANKDWISTTTPSEVLNRTPSMGKIYLPEGSYREMTEWAMPAERQVAYDDLRHDLQESSQWDRVAPFVHGGFWRNFKVRYPESDEMYTRMLQLSHRLHALTDSTSASAFAPELLERARTALYRAQCNCSYWHGAFGGIYLPHLRNAVYEHLIAADTLLEKASDRASRAWVDGQIADINFDGQDEIVLSNDQLVSLVQPAVGGQMYELDIRSIRHNILATLARRPEAYHAKVLAGPNNSGDHGGSIHERVVFKQEGLDQLLQYDDHLRKSLQDHFFDPAAQLHEVVSGSADEKGDFLAGTYEPTLLREADSIELQLRRTGVVEGTEISITKTLKMTAGSSALDVTYLVEGLPQDRPLHFAVEFNFAGMPAGADDRYFYDANRTPLGQLGESLDLQSTQGIGLIDEWLGLDVGLSCNRPTHLWAYPIATVSQSEGGFEAVHQSVVVLPHWLIQGDAEGRWGVAMTLSIDTSLAESRADAREAVTAQ